MSMWLLILLLLVADAIVGYCWWRDRRALAQERQAHQKSRNALEFWRGYRGKKDAGAPTTVPLHLMDSDHGMAAVREVIRQRVTEHRAGRSRDTAVAVALLLLACASTAGAQQPPPAQAQPPAAATSPAKPEAAPVPAVDPNAPLPIPERVAQEVQALQREMQAHQVSIGTLQDRMAVLSSRVNQALQAALPAGRVLALVCRDGTPECADDQRMLMMIVPPATADGAKK